MNIVSDFSVVHIFEIITLRNGVLVCDDNMHGDPAALLQHLVFYLFSVFFVCVADY